MFTWYKPNGMIMSKINRFLVSRIKTFQEPHYQRPLLEKDMLHSYFSKSCFDLFGSVWQIEKIDLCKFGSELCLSCFILCFINFGNFLATVCFYSIHFDLCLSCFILEFRVCFGDIVCYLL